MTILKSRKGRVFMVSVIMVSLMAVFSLPVWAAEYKQLGGLRSVADDDHQALNNVAVTVGKGELSAGDVLIVRLPEGFCFNSSGWSPGTVGADMYYGDYADGCYIFVPWDEENGLNMDADPEENPVSTDIFSVSELDDNEFRIKVKDIPGFPSLTEDGFFLIYLKDVDVPRGFRGAIKLSFYAPGGSGFGPGEINGGRVGRVVPEEEKTSDVENGADNGSDQDNGDIPDEDKSDGEKVEGLTVVFTVGDPTFTLNGETRIVDAAPYIKDGRTYLPMRFAALALGVNDNDIRWANGMAMFVLEGRNVTLSLGSNVMNINGDPVNIDAAPEILNGRLMLPVKWLGSALGAYVYWDPSTQSVTVSK